MPVRTPEGLYLTRAVGDPEPFGGDFLSHPAAWPHGMCFSAWPSVSLRVFLWPSLPRPRQLDCSKQSSFRNCVPRLPAAVTLSCLLGYSVAHYRFRNISPFRFVVFPLSSVKGIHSRPYRRERKIMAHGKTCFREGRPIETRRISLIQERSPLGYTLSLPHQVAQAAQQLVETDRTWIPL